MKQSTLVMDFGTSNTLVGAVIDGKSFSALPLDPFSPDPTVIRTLLFFPDGNKAYYGHEAIDAYEDHDFEGRFIKSIKKFLPVQSYLGSYIDNRMVKLEDLIHFFMLEMKKRAEKHLNHQFDSILLGRPAKYSQDSAKDNLALYRMTKAAELAGFKYIAYLPEPIAAAHDFSSEFQESKLVLVVDLGGGTSDFTVVNMHKNKIQQEDVLAISGVPVAGDKYDGSIMEHKIAKYLGANVTYRAPLGKNILQMPKALLDHICSPGDLTQFHKKEFYAFFKGLKSWNVSSENRKKLELLEVIVDDNLGFKVFEAIEKAKVTVNLEGSAHFHYKYTDLEIIEDIHRDEFDTFSQKHTNKIFDELHECLKLAQLKPEDIDFIYCTGGTSKLNSIQTRLKKMFSEEKVQSGNAFNSVLAGLNKYAIENLC